MISLPPTPPPLRGRGGWGVKGIIASVLITKFQVLYLIWGRASTRHLIITKISMTEIPASSLRPFPLRRKGKGEGRFGYLDIGDWDLFGI